MIRILVVILMIIPLLLRGQINPTITRNNVELLKSDIRGLEINSNQETEYRLEFQPHKKRFHYAVLTSLDRFGDQSSDLIFSLQHEKIFGVASSWSIMESWRGAGLMISASGPDLHPLTFGINRIEKMRLSESGNFGIGTTEPKSKVEVANGDIYVSAPRSGLIVKSPNGECWRLTVTNRGKAKFKKTTCPE